MRGLAMRAASGVVFGSLPDELLLGGHRGLHWCWVYIYVEAWGSGEESQTLVSSKDQRRYILTCVAALHAAVQHHCKKDQTFLPLFSTLG